MKDGPQFLKRTAMRRIEDRAVSIASHASILVRLQKEERRTSKELRERAKALAIALRKAEAEMKELYFDIRKDAR